MAGIARGLPRSVASMAMLALLLLALALSLGVGQGSVSAYGEGEDVRRIANKLQCPVCEGTSAADSPSPVAQGMRDKIQEMLAEGRSEKEIMSFFVAVYGDFVLREPPKTGLAAAVWWVPPAAIAVGLGLVYTLVWRNRRRKNAPVLSPASLGLADDEIERYRERLREEMEERGG